MQNLKLKNRPSGQAMLDSFRVMVGNDYTPENKVYHPEPPYTYTKIRPVAEYEEMGGVVISYPGTVAPDSKHKQLPPTGPRNFGIPDELIVRMQQADTANPVHVFIFCDDETELPKITARLQKCAEEKGIEFEPKLLHLIPWDTDTYWTRDYAPWWIVDKKTGHYSISKHLYTSLGGGSVGLIEGAEEVTARQGSGIFRCNDDYGAVRLSDFLNAPIRRWNNASWNGVSRPDKDKIDPHGWFFSGLLNVGGNYMATSRGVLASSYLVATQNELPSDINPEDTTPSEDTLDSRMRYIMEQTHRFLGAETYHVLADPTGTYIGHIDCWGKFLSDDKVLIAETDSDKVNVGLDRIAEHMRSKGGFKVYRVHCPNIYVPTEESEPATTAPYTNSLILNKRVYVPLVGDDYYDMRAIGAYQEALKDEGYDVIGIYGKPDTPWLGTDALHCRTNAIPRAVVDNWLRSLKLK